jgi:putative hydrolase of the HAD superfamily
MNEVLVFDLDDTLFLEKDFVLSGFKSVDVWLTQTSNIKGFYDVCLNIYMSGIRGYIFNRALDELKAIYDLSLIEKMVQVYRLHIPKISLLDDAKEILSYFSSKKSLSIITDGYYATQANKIEALGLNRLFDFIIYSDANGKQSWKPSEWPYLELMKCYTKNDLEFIYIGDNILKDFITARKLGWKTVHISRAQGEYNIAQASKEYHADFKIDSLIKLKELIIL